MTKFSRLTLSAALLTAFAVPAMASVPAWHRAPAKAQATRGPVRHIAATTTAADPVRTPAVSSTAVAPLAPGTAAPAVTKPGIAATAPTTVTTAPSTTLAAPGVAAKPAVKVN